MPPRSVKMKRFIFGFQRRVWWPKWTPASSSSFMETTGMESPFLGFGCRSPATVRWGPRRRRPPSTFPCAGGRDWTASSYRLCELVQVCPELGRERRSHVDALAAERVRERELRRVQELQADRRQVDADLVHTAGLEPHAQERVPVEEPLELEMRDRVSRGGGGERDARRVGAVTADRRLDPTGARARTAGDEREVRPLDRAAAHETCQPP